MRHARIGALSLKKNGIATGMDGEVRRRDNVFVERIWKSIKYEAVYLHACVSVSEARISIGCYQEFLTPSAPIPA